jgi:hypothetical protein
MNKNYTSAFVTYDGDYSSDADILLFNQDDLTAEQWETVVELSDSSRYEYIRAVLDGRSLSQWEL